MAYVWTKNSTPSNGAQALFLLKALLKTAGWTVPRSGDGLALYSASSDIITTNTTGAGGLANNRAWFSLKQPGIVTTAQRELMFQYDPTDTAWFNWRWKYSWNAGFITGTSNATVTPSASDQVVLNGSGTEAAPVGAGLFGGGYGTATRVQMFANNAAPYDFGMVSHPSGGGSAFHALIMDGMVSGSYNALDVDPYVFYLDTAVPFNGSSFGVLGASGLLKANYKKGIAGASFQDVAALLYSNGGGTGVIPGLLGVDAYSSKDSIYPVFYARHNLAGAPAGPKGQSSALKWCSNPRSTGDTLTVATTKDYYCAMGFSPFCVAIPWDGTTPTV